MKDAGNKHRRSQAEGAGIEGYIETKKYTLHRRKKRKLILVDTRC